MGQEGIDDHVQVGFFRFKNAIGFMKHKTKRTISSPTPQTSKMIINRLGKPVMGSLNVWNFKLPSNTIG